MGKALELITAQATAPGTGAAMAAVAGNSLTIRDSRKPIRMIGLWHRRQAAGLTRITSPLMHDAVVGMGMTSPAGVSCLWGLQAMPQDVVAQDTLVMTATGSAAAGDIEQSSYLLYYDDLPGASANLITSTDFRRRASGQVYSPSNTLALGTAGGYSGEELINAEQDQLYANREYALVGYTISGGDCVSVRWRSTDTSNLGVGGPGASGLGGLTTADWFIRCAEWTGLPVIPVFNAANKSQWFVDGATDENGVDVTVSPILMLLK